MSRALGHVAACGALFALLGASSVSAQPVYTHAIQEGDTLASIAQRYYGDPTREAVLREANRVKGVGANGLLPGSWIFVPMVTFYEVSEGDTWASLAAKLYGRENRAATLIDEIEYRIGSSIRH